MCLRAELLGLYSTLRPTVSIFFRAVYFFIAKAVFRKLATQVRIVLRKGIAPWLLTLKWTRNSRWVRIIYSIFLKNMSTTNERCSAYHCWSMFVSLSESKNGIIRTIVNCNNEVISLLSVISYPYLSFLD